MKSHGNDARLVGGPMLPVHGLSDDRGELVLRRLWQDDDKHSIKTAGACAFVTRTGAALLDGSVAAADLHRVEQVIVDMDLFEAWLEHRKKVAARHYEDDPVAIREAIRGSIVDDASVKRIQQEGLVGTLGTYLADAVSDEGKRLRNEIVVAVFNPMTLQDLYNGIFSGPELPPAWAAALN